MVAYCHTKSSEKQKAIKKAKVFLNKYLCYNSTIMYFIIYPLFYLLSLLPWWLMYLISDALYLLIYYAIGYRKKVVLQNLLIAFPDKTESERTKIAKDFYRNFVDNFIETIKLISISDKEFDKRCKFDATLINDLHAKGYNIQLHSGHFFNWEFVNLGISKHFNGKFLGVYMPLSNKSFNKLIIKLRSKYNTVLISVPEFRTSFHNYTKELYALGLVADQKPGNVNKASWLPFFGKMTPFYTGPEKGALRMNTAVVMVNFFKVKRGYYQIDSTLLTTTPKELPAGTITKELIIYIENCIKNRPANYLWSHRRWKFEYDEKLHSHLKI